MNWKRIRSGVYQAGPFLVEQHDYGWYASGPGIDGSFDRKDQAQGHCCQVAGDRAADPATEPVPGDAVLLGGKRPGRVHSLLRFDGRVTYSIHLARGRRLCLRRDEFEVVVP